PHISHVSGHMGFQSLSPEVDRLVGELAAGYGLIYKTSLKRLDFRKDHSAESYVPAFVRALEKASPGSYLFVEHPALEGPERSEEHTSELQSRENLVCRLLLEKKKPQSQH